MQVAGPVLSLRRPTPAFAFVEYGDPESVLRCLQVVNGAEICPPEGQPKALLVKADDKTRARLDEYEATREKTEVSLSRPWTPDSVAKRARTDPPPPAPTHPTSQTHADALAQAQSDLIAILSLIRTGAAPSSQAPAARAGEEGGARSLRASTDLTELEAQELPEEHREIITGEIAHFRERMAKVKAKKEAEARQREAQIKAMAQRSAAPSPSAGASRFASSAQDPQSFNKPIGFVAQGGAGVGAGAGPSGAAEAAAPPEVMDVEKERLRAERVAREADALFRDVGSHFGIHIRNRQSMRTDCCTMYVTLQRERRYEQRERNRIVGVERERARERQLTEQEERERRSMAERLAAWDDDREAEKGRELFYSDRQRWRAQRRAARQREVEADERDRATEEAQLATLSKQADEFLSNALPDLKPLAAGRAGDGTPGGAVKVSFGAAAAKPVAKAAPAVRAPVMGLADEEDDVKKKRELIPLSYSDDEDDDKKPQVSGRAKRESVLAAVPDNQAGLWAFHIKWNALNKVSTRHTCTGKDNTKGPGPGRRLRSFHTLLTGDAAGDSATRSTREWRARASTTRWWTPAQQPPSSFALCCRPSCRPRSSLWLRHLSLSPLARPSPSS